MPALMFLVSFASGIEQIMLVFASALAGAITVFIIARIIESFFPLFLAGSVFERGHRGFAPVVSLPGQRPA
jgi:hypothetical protein